MSLPDGWVRAEAHAGIESGQAWVFPVSRDGDQSLYALKRLKNPRRLERFRREISVMRDLSSKGVPVPIVIEGGVDAKDRPYFVMPWYPQGSVENWLSLDPDAIERLDLLIAIADALQLCHAAGVAHRDIKPANILLTDDVKPMLADLGLARDKDDGRLTEVEEGVGSRFYMAPENESGINPDNDQRPADAYAFGKVCWVILTGRKPLARELILDPPNRLAALLNDERLAALDTLIERLLDPDPRSRLTEWADVKAELSRVRSLLVPSEPPAPSPDEGDSVNFLKMLERLKLDANTAESVRARDNDRRRQNRWNEIQGVISRRVALSVDQEIESFNQAGGDVGVVVHRSSGGPQVERLTELPTFADLDLSRLPQWARGTSGTVLLTIEGGLAHLPRRIYVAAFALPEGEYIRFVRAVFCYPDNQRDFLIVAAPPPFTANVRGPRMNLDGVVEAAESFADETVRVARTVWTSFIAELVDGGAVEAAVGVGLNR